MNKLVEKVAWAIAKADGFDLKIVDAEYWKPESHAAILAFLDAIAEPSEAQMEVVRERAVLGEQTSRYLYRAMIAVLRKEVEP